MRVNDPATVVQALERGETTRVREMLREMALGLRVLARVHEDNARPSMAALCRGYARRIDGR
jgi:hypothetical protein